MNYLGDFATSAVIYIPFATYDKDDGSSITMTGLAVTDIEIYKNGAVTQRASDSGYTLLDTDGIDFDGITGLHGFSIDTSDNADAGFFAAGNEYQVAVSAITVDAVTVNFWAATFSIERSGGALALLKHATYGLSAIETLVDDLETRCTEARLAELDAANLPTDVANVKTDTAAILVDTGTTLDAKLNNIQGATFDTATDSLEALRNRGDAAWITATGFSTHSAADIWAVATRVLTAGTNIALAKGTGVTGFNDLDAGGVATAIWNAATATYGSAGSYGLLTETNLDATVSSRLAASGYTAPDNTGIDFIEKWINNKLVESPPGTWKLYDDDGTTVLKTWTWDSGIATRSKAT